MTIRLSVQAALKLMGNRGEQIVRGTLIDISTGVIMATPVDEGTLRANWRASIGSPQLGEIDEQDTNGAPTVSKAEAQIQNMMMGEDYFLSNSMPYAYDIEFGNVSKIKAPQGMLRITLARLPSIMGGQ